jgi:hypothetical protein
LEDLGIDERIALKWTSEIYRDYAVKSKGKGKVVPVPFFN